MPNGSLFAVRDANAGRSRNTVDQYLAMDRAGRIAEFTDALLSIGVPIFHTLAADSHGDAFYGEVAAVPHVTDTQLEDCRTALGRLPALFSDGALVTPTAVPRPASGARTRTARRTPISTATKATGSATRTGRGPASPPSSASSAMNARSRACVTRLGHLMVRDRREAVDGLDDVLAVCAGIDAATDPGTRALEACDVLARWDRRADPDSRGAQVFTEFWRAVHRKLGGGFKLPIESRDFWAVDFGPADPLHTPSGINASRTGNRGLVREALAAAVDRLEGAVSTSTRCEDQVEKALIGEPLVVEEE